MENIVVKKIKNNDIQNLLINFLYSTQINKSQKENLSIYIGLFKNICIEDLNWSFICKTSNKVDTENSKFTIFASLHMKFIKYILDKEIFIGPHSDRLKVFIRAMCDRIDSQRSCRSLRKSLFIENLKLDQVFMYCIKDRNFDDEERHIIINTRCHNTFIVNLLEGFYNTKVFSSSNRNKDFVNRFVDSYSNLDTFSSVADFNYSVFKSQYDFYKDKPAQLRELIRFYIYMYSISEFTDMFKDTDPVNMIWMQKPNFLHLYNQGFELVNYNPFEEPPQIDKWVVKPNGFEKTSTKLKHSSYFKLDFSDIEHELYKFCTKHAFWNSTFNLKSRIEYVSFIKEFFEFITNHKKISIKEPEQKVNFKDITPVEIYSFRYFLIENLKSVSTINVRINRLRAFLTFCNHKDYLNVDKACFDYLNCLPKEKGKGGNDIPDQELTLLEDELRKLSEEDLTYNLYYIIFHIAIETSFRISQILSLKKESIKEGMKEGQFFIESTNKTSSGDLVLQGISPYAKRHLDIAIEHTKQLRKMASNKNKDFIFLCKKQYVTSQEISPIEPFTFNAFLKKICKQLNIKEYTAENLRDTHMTKAVEYGFKKGLSPFEISALTEHKDIRTTNNHYVNHKIRTFAEIMYGVTIGDVDIKGNILPKNNDTFKTEDIVDDGCGYCKENKCKILSELGCPMCDGFVVTLDRIPFYEQKIKEIDMLIKNETIKHEREHLYSIKKLYVAYLERLYTLKEELNNSQEVVSN